MNIIKRIFLILNLLVLNQLYAQIKIELNIDYLNKKAKVVLLNESNTNLVIPLDTLTLSPYFDDICLEIKNYIHGSPYLGLNIKLKNEDTISDFLGGSGKMDDLSVVNIISKEKKKYERKIRLWQRKNNIKSFEEAKINYYVFNNLVYLNPGDKIERTFYFDLHNITNGKYMYYYYRIEDDKQYNVSLSFNIEDCIYKYLTTSQKEKFSEYKLFTGKIESNKIELKQ